MMERYNGLIEARIVAWCGGLPENGLYAPMAYLMGLPAKRVRPALVLMGCELFGGAAEDVMEEAMGIELFHNFTLMHDDIMDKAPLRRGRPTVHEKWGVNTAILSGDAMLVKAYQALGRYPEVHAVFSRCALEVCEGQQLDMDFERRADVGVDEYMEMIRLKTAVLLACALRIGGIVAGAGQEDQDRIAAFGEHLGLAFQLRDDVLDAFGDPAKTGKQQGGDLRAGKKTFLLIRGLERAAENRTGILRDELAKRPDERDVPRMLGLLETLGVRDEAEALAIKHHRAAYAQLEAIKVPEEGKMPLIALADRLVDRSS
ncbi:MAG: polyprenyl synthetase family protein [Flavobacteriales bacterium]|nr:polyprenyl synthetase family protein [Flavobacteriales bacterium]